MAILEFSICKVVPSFRINFVQNTILSYRDIDIEEFNYSLPEERIAAYPLARGESKLLIYKDGKISQSQYKYIAEALPENTWMVFNETKVVQARLLFPKNENSLIEVFCLEPYGGLSIEQAMQMQGSIEYLCLVGGARKWKDHDLYIDLGSVKLKAEKLERLDSSFRIRLSWTGDINFAEMLELAGKTPLPPYIKRAAEETDKTTYQTSYARKMGSVAAPTAGLHFNDAIFNDLDQKGIARNFLTLHVGAGTFKPVSSSVAEHEMHAEEVFMEANFIRSMHKALLEAKPIICVGTTSLRAIESMYWLACMLKGGKHWDLDNMIIPQWIGFDQSFKALSPIDALEVLLNFFEDQAKDWLSFKTQIIIAPGYQHRIIKGLVTNFHQPKSTLMLLIASILGDDWQKVYQYALDNDFRFLSYGDGCLLNYDGTNA